METKLGHFHSAKGIERNREKPGVSVTQVPSRAPALQGQALGHFLLKGFFGRAKVCLVLTGSYRNMFLLRFGGHESVSLTRAC